MKPKHHEPRDEAQELQPIMQGAFLAIANKSLKTPATKPDPKSC